MTAPPPAPAGRLPDIRRIAVGSTNPGKIAAVRRVSARLWPAAEVAGVRVDSGVAVQPRGDAAGARGALLRAAAARAAADADLGIGLEGSTDEFPFAMYTLAWAAVVDRAERVGLASTGRCPLPATVAAAIQAGGELGPLVDALTGARNTKHDAGASGVFTAGHTDRVTSLAGGLIYACAPFLTPQFFGPDAMGRLPAVLAQIDATRPLRADYTVCFVRRPDGCVLLLARRYPPNAGRLNGLGGGIEPGEDALAAATRELREEAGLRVRPHLGALITLWEAERLAAGAPGILLYVCRADVDAASAARVPADCLEGRLDWYDPRDLARLALVPNIPIFLPPLLDRAPGAGALSGTFWYEAGWRGGHYLLHTPDGMRAGLIPD